MTSGERSGYILRNLKRTGHRDTYAQHGPLTLAQLSERDARARERVARQTAAWDASMATANACTGGEWKGD